MDELGEATPPAGGVVEDMIMLDDLSQETLLRNLRERFAIGEIYTAISSILVAVNPFRDMAGSYGEDVAMRYAERADRRAGRTVGAGRGAAGDDELPPHVFAIASRAYYSAVKTGRTQAVIISGESGAGKTETTKFILSYLALASRYGDTHADQGIETRIVEANPVIEAFGNAQTLRNNNSSRFGKLISVQLGASGSITSGSLVNYLLEKSRVARQMAGERNFHIFYQLAAAVRSGMSLKEASIKDLPASMGDAHALQYLRVDAASTDSDVDAEAARFLQTCQAMDVMSIGVAERTQVFVALAAILQVGNVQFEPMDADDPASVSASSRPFLKQAAALLSVHVGILEAVLLTRRMGAGGGRSVVTVKYSATQAADARDALAKQLYAQLFDWLVSRVNASLQDRVGQATALQSGPGAAMARISDLDESDSLDGDGVEAVHGAAGLAAARPAAKTAVAAPQQAAAASIDVLDIFGFEIFETNSFEQLCINYCNQKLQCFFDDNILKLEQEEYARQGVVVPVVETADNQPCLDLIEMRPNGIFSMLDEELSVPNGSEANLLAKMSKNHAAHPNFVQKRGTQSTFTVAHYAGPVTYEIVGFMEKNKDLLHADIAGCLRSARDPFIQLLFATGDRGFRRRSSVVLPGAGAAGGAAIDSATAKREALRANSSSHRRKAGGMETLCSKFKSQLASLMRKLDVAEPHFIRCLKPNSVAQPGVFEDELVVSQMRCSGLQQVCEVRRVGFPVRLEFPPFVDRFSRASAALSVDVGELCSHLVALGVLAEGQWAKGTSKIFFSHKQMSRLDRFEDRANAAACSVVHAMQRVVAKRRQQRRGRVLSALSTAVEQRNFEEVQTLVEECADLLPERGLHLPSVKQALALIPRLAEEGRIRVDLKRGMEQRDAQLLRSSVAAADALDPPMEEDALLEAARMLLVRVEREATLEVDLATAIATKNHAELLLLLHLADDLALMSDDVQRAKVLREGLEKEALNAVEAAARDLALEKLRVAIAAAVAMKLSASPIMVVAGLVLEDLKLQHAALQALQAACTARGAEDVQAALDVAEKFDRPCEQLSESIADAQALRDRLKRMESVATDLRSALLTSSASENFMGLDRLVELVAEAQTFHVEEPTAVPDAVLDAASQSVLLIEQRELVQQLSAAVETSDKEQIGKALVTATAVSLEHAIVVRAKDHLALLVQHEAMCMRLRALHASSDAADLRAALAAALDMGLPDCDELLTVRLLVIDFDLALAVKDNTEEALTAAIKHAGELKVDNAVVMGARDALALLQRQAEVRKEEKRMQVCGVGGLHTCRLPLY